MKGFARNSREPTPRRRINWRQKVAVSPSRKGGLFLVFQSRGLLGCLERTRLYGRLAACAFLETLFNFEFTHKGRRIIHILVLLRSSDDLTFIIYQHRLGEVSCVKSLQAGRINLLSLSLHLVVNKCCLRAVVAVLVAVLVIEARLY